MSQMITRITADLNQLDDQVVTLCIQGEDLTSPFSPEKIINWEKKADNALEILNHLEKKIQRSTQRIEEVKKSIKDAEDLIADHNSDGCNPYR